MDNFAAMEPALGLDIDQARHLAANSIRSSFLSVARKEELLQQVLTR
jgi:adenosine deaminase